MGTATAKTQGQVPRAPRWWAALAGVVAAGTGLAVAEVMAGIVDPASSPVLAAGGAVVDAAPPWLKDLAVGLFGTADKAVLLGIMGAVLAAGAALAGVLEARRPPWGAALLAAVGLAGALVATTRPGATAVWALPGVVGVAVAVPLLRALAGMAAPGWSRPAGPGTPSGPASDTVDRRRFLVWSGTAVGVSLVALATSRLVTAGSRAVQAVRDSLRLPTPASPAPAVPAGAELGLEDLATYLTPNETFYRIDTALTVPQVDPATWSLRVTGLVDEPYSISWDDLLALPLVEHHVTLACVSNEVGGDLIGNALWLGYPIRELLARARPHGDADMVLSQSVDGFTAGTPLEVLLDPDRESLLAIAMNGEPLPPEHGFPARLVVPGLYGYVSATKWVTELKVTRFADDQGYWTPRGWSALGPIKLQSRIDVPFTGTDVERGEVVVAGVAWAQHTGIGGVEVRVDDGEWQPGELAETVGPDTWRQWRYRWDATSASPGTHLVSVRAIDSNGVVQTGDEAPPAPDGATGWHTVPIDVV